MRDKTGDRRRDIVFGVWGEICGCQGALKAFDNPSGISPFVTVFREKFVLKMWRQIVSFLEVFSLLAKEHHSEYAGEGYH